MTSGSLQGAVLLLSQHQRGVRGESPKGRSRNWTVKLMGGRKDADAAEERLQARSQGTANRQWASQIAH